MIVQAKNIVGVVIAGLLVSCSTQSTYTPKTKVQMQSGVQLQVVVDCSVEAVDLANGFERLPPEAGYNESICKLITGNLESRLKEAEYGKRISRIETARVSVGRTYAESIDAELEQLRDASKENEPHPKIALLEDYKISGSFDLVDSGLSQSQMNAIDEITESFLSVEAEFAGDFESSHGRNRKLIGSTIPSFSRLNMGSSEYFLFYQVRGLHVVSDESAGSRAGRVAADAAITAATCLLGACVSTGIGGDIDSNVEVRPILIDSKGTVVWTSAAGIEIQDEDSLMTVAALAVEQSLPMDIFKNTPEHQDASEQPDENEREETDVPTPVLLEA